MSPRSAAPFAARAMAAILLVAVLVGLAGCAGPSFDPSGPCATDGRAAGAYPELEADVPKLFRGRAPDRLDSGRNCTPQALATLAAHGVSALRFAGATWDLGSSSGVTLAVFDAPDLDAAWVAEFYETGARAARKTVSVEARTMAIPNGRPGSRIDALNGESYQSVIVWSDGEHVRVALIASFIREVETKEAHNAVVDEALAAAILRWPDGVRNGADTPRRPDEPLAGSSHVSDFDHAPMDWPRRPPPVSAAQAPADPDRDRGLPDRPWSSPGEAGGTR